MEYPNWKRKVFDEMYGRRLLQSETSCTKEELLRGVQEGLLLQLPGIENRKGKLRCNGCGNINPELFAAHACYRCQKSACYYCRNCISVRKISGCTPLYAWKNEHQPPQKTKAAHMTAELLQWTGQLTPEQEKASQAIIQQIQEKKDCLVYAVTGAGKTEMLFQPIAYALSCEKQICFASPRTDVIVEIAPRLQRVFPKIEIGIYFGGSEEKNPRSPLILATTHQLMRFHQRFDVLILDESDAFPYQGDPALKYSLHQALKPNHSLVYCTATPEPLLLKERSRSDMKIVFVSRRFHGRPLEIPEWIWVGKWKEKLSKAKISQKFMRRLQERLAMGRQIFVFVPYVETAKQLHMILAGSSINSSYVYAEDLMRRQKIEAFRNQAVDVMVTTTILERGVTVPFVDVFVLGSESRIFDAAALVQICGRAGRHMDDNIAKVYFFHEGITREMRKAKKQIMDMNRRAVSF